MQDRSRPLGNCQICQDTHLQSILFLGYLPPVNSMPLLGSVPREQMTFPLEILRCPKCTLVQLGTEVQPEILFPPDYPYLSGTTKILRENFSDLYAECHALLELKADDLCIDIGSNDGTLLGNFKRGGHKVLGIEPSRASDIANQNGIPTKMAFFSETLAQEMTQEVGMARVITAANVFAHIGNVHSIVRGIKTLLAPRGVFVNESHYLLDLLENIQYDTIYHEHLRYYSLTSLIYLLKGHGLEVFKVKRIPTHGGSIRVYSAQQGLYKIDPSVAHLLAEEEAAGLSSGRALDIFRKRVIESKSHLIQILGNLRSQGHRIYGIGAPSRASTLINYTGIDDGLVDCILELKGSAKLNKYIPSTRIPVLDESILYTDQPEYALLFSWHIAEELIKNLKSHGYRGKFIVPLPEPRIIE